MKRIRSPYNMQNLSEGVKHEALLIKLSTELIRTHNAFIKKLDDVNALVNKKVGPQGKEGAQGPKGDNTPVLGIDYFTEADVEKMLNILTIRLGKAQDGTPGYTPVKGKDYFTRDEIEQIAMRAAKYVEPGRPGKDAKMDPEEFLKLFTQKGKKLSTKHIDGLEQTISAHYNQLGRNGYIHGGGDTVQAGSNVTITRNNAGHAVINAPNAGVTYVDNEVVAGSGTNWTLAGTPAAGSEHITVNGQRLTPGAANDYVITGNAITTAGSYAVGALLADYRL